MDTASNHAIDATTRILDGLASSDFVTNSGANAVKELRCYGSDIACDIFTVFAGRDPNENERASFVAAFPDNH
jgi:hypothetical protein